MEADDRVIILTIADDGIGLSGTSAATGGGLGLPNLRRRAEKLHGTLSFDSTPDGGTVLTWKVPIDI